MFALHHYSITRVLGESEIDSAITAVRKVLETQVELFLKQVPSKNLEIVR